MTTTNPTRISPKDIETYNREGYLVVDEPIFPQDDFDALKAHFEHKLDLLPPEIRPEAMDVPHLTDPALFRWLFHPAVLDIVESAIGPDIALFSSHFICKPRGNGKRVPWHEDSAYWKGLLSPMQVVTVWLAIDPSTEANGCMKVIPRTHDNGFSDYEDVDPTKNVFTTEIKRHQFDAGKAIAIELQPNHASLHDGKLMHGSDPNTSSIRRCGYTMRYVPTTVRFNHEEFGNIIHLYLARGKDRAGNIYGDPTTIYENLRRYRENSSRNFH